MAGMTRDLQIPLYHASKTYKEVRQIDIKDSTAQINTHHARPKMAAAYRPPPPISVVPYPDSNPPYQLLPVAEQDVCRTSFTSDRNTTFMLAFT